MNNIEERIVEHLEQITKILELSNQLPSKDGISTKGGDRSKNTPAQAKAEYEMRLGNLKNLDGAGERTDKENQDIRDKIQKMR